MSNQTDTAKALQNLAQNTPKPLPKPQNPKSLINSNGQTIKLNDPPKSNHIK
jgi:hypothetical protein